jgi:hypothetical protein
LNAFISNRLIILFSAQRFIVVFFPLKRNDFCNKTKTKFVIIVLFVFSIAFYSYALFTSSIERNRNGQKECVTISKWYDIVDIISFIDTIQTLILPFVLICIINLSILFKLVRTLGKPIEIKDRNQRVSVMPLTRKIDNNRIKSSIFEISSSLLKSKSTTSHLSRNILMQRHQNRSKSKSSNKKAFLLLAIVTIFLVINCPLTVKKTLRYFGKLLPYRNLADFHESMISVGIDLCKLNNTNAIINVKFQNQTFEFDVKEEMKSIQKLQIGTKMATFTYYINFSINFYLYTFKLKQFRKNLFKMFKK